MAGIELPRRPIDTDSVKDEWVFSIAVPVGSRRQVVRLRRAQPTTPRPHRRSSRTSDDEDAAAEKISLLSAQETIEDDEEPSPAETLATGWTLTSPYWSLHNEAILTVTYFPAWQALPEYTQSSCARVASCCEYRPPIDYMAYTFTSADIVSTQSIPDFMVKGVGRCQALKVYFEPLDISSLSTTAPPHLQGAWDRQLEQMSKNRQGSSEVPTSTPRLGPIVTFCLPQSLEDPPLLWNVHFPSCAEPIAIESFTVLDGRLVFSRNEQPSPTHIYINGWQSWSFAGSIPKGQRQPTSAMPDTFSRAFNFGGSAPPPADVQYNEHHRPAEHPFASHYQSDFFTCVTSDGQVPETSPYFIRRRQRPVPYAQLDETGGPALILGWLANRKHFGVITSDRRLERFQMHASGHGQVLVSGSIHTDFGYVQLVSPHSYDEEPMVHYLHAVASANEARPLQNGSLLTGWCSWYVFYERISRDLLRDNFDKLAVLRSNVPTNVSVVDDGYMTAWGDWDSVKKLDFPTGLREVSQDISQHGMRPGLWMAPFAADKHSKLAKNHPDWIIKNHAGVAANSSNCGKFFYGLDATNPEVRAYVHHCVRRAVQDWGFNVLKIDFLYAACLEGNGKFDLSLSRAEAMHMALETIRDAAGPDVFLIGCGCPIATAIGFADAMRVSADTGPTWYPAPPLPWWDMGTLPSLRSMIRNSVSRASIGHRWWHNDPDCLMFGEHTRLTDDEVASAASIVGMTCGMLLLSDDLPKVPANRMLILSKIFPLTGVSAVVLDLHSTNNGLPSLLRLWCTDKDNVIDDIRETISHDSDDLDHNAEATLFARKASFRPDAAPSAPDERHRTCIHVTKGLGTWTVVSISNWLDRDDVVHIPPPALLPAPTTGWGNETGAELRQSALSRDYGEYGYHVFAFWSAKYSWLPTIKHEGEHGPEQTISKRLPPHATEIFHIRPVKPGEPQYVGSDLHFSCGREVRSFAATEKSLCLGLNTDYHRTGRIFVFIPKASTESIRVSVRGREARWVLVGNTPKVNGNGSTPRLLGRVIAIPVTIMSDGNELDGEIRIDF